MAIKIRQFTFLILVALAAALILFALSKLKNSGGDLDATSRNSNEVQKSAIAEIAKRNAVSKPALSPPNPQDVMHQSSHPDARAIGSSALPAVREPAVLLGLFESYRQKFGAFPAGEGNAQFMNALRGSNPASLPIFPASHERLNSNGELLDAWGNAFIFHPVSRQHLEIRSAGKDGSPYTEDDIVVPQKPDEVRK